MAINRGAVVITGASTGIGAACALDLNQQGYRVFAGVRRLEDAAALRKRASDSLTPILLDVTQPEQIQSAVSIITQAVGDSGLAGLVNNAGIAIGGPLEFLSLEKLRKQFEVNVIGLVAVTQAFLPLIRQGKGRIINMSSFGGSIASPFLAPYHASKFALEAISDSLRMELTPWGIDVVVIKPSAVKTPIWEKALQDGKALTQNLSAQALEYYGDAAGLVSNRLKQSQTNGADVSIVTQAVFRALTAPRPKTRYVVAINRFKYHLLRLLPDRLRDRLILNNIGLNRS